MDVKKYISDNLFDKKGRLCSPRLNEKFIDSNVFEVISSHCGGSISENIYRIMHDIPNGDVSCEFCDSKVEYDRYYLGFKKTCMNRDCLLMSYGKNPHIPQGEELKSLSKRMKINNPMKNKYVSNKVRDANLGRKLSKKHCDKLSISHRNFYNRIKSGYEYGFLYVLSSDTVKKIKIGITNNMDRRVKELSIIYGDLTVMYTLTNIEYKNLTGLESYLFDKFDSYCEPEPMGKSGRTEWFNESVSSEVISVLENIKNNVVKGVLGK